MAKRSPYTVEGPAVISFSGGRTSAFLLRKILDAGLQKDVHILFANTGKERPETLSFVHECETRWAVDVKWLEYTPFTRSTPLHARYTTTCFADASRNGEPFDALVKNRKRLPNPLMRICTQELKIRPMREYMKAHGFKHWNMIVGLRADEPHRVARMEALNEQAKERWQTVMPLAKTGVAEKDVLSFWKAQDFDLKLKTWEGNCDLCFLKARDKKVRIMQERPDLAAWWLAKEKQIGQPFRKSGLDYAGLVDRAKKMLPVIQPIEGALDDDLGDCFCTS